MRILLRILQFLPPIQSPLLFAARSCRDSSHWHWNPGLGGLLWGWDTSLLKCPSQFLSTTHACGTACSMSPCLFTSLCLLPFWMNVASLIPWLSNFHIARFSDNSGWYLLYSWVVIFAVVVWRVKPCLPTLASWLEVLWPSILITFTLAMTPNV